MAKSEEIPAIENEKQLGERMQESVVMLSDVSEALDKIIRRSQAMSAFLESGKPEKSVDDLKTMGGVMGLMVVAQDAKVIIDTLLRHFGHAAAASLIEEMVEMMVGKK